MPLSVEQVTSCKKMLKILLLNLSYNVQVSDVHISDGDDHAHDRVVVVDDISVRCIIPRNSQHGNTLMLVSYELSKDRRYGFGWLDLSKDTATLQTHSLNRLATMLNGWQYQRIQERLHEMQKMRSLAQA